MPSEKREFEKNNRKTIIVLTITILLLVVQIAFMLNYVNALQGNARVVNYAGIVRGATQRLVKNELYSNRRDESIERLDKILSELKTGKGELNLTVLDDEYYQKKLDELSKKWERVKEEIYASRIYRQRRDVLYQLSEKYFELADETVSAAEAYSDGVAKKLSITEVTVVINILFILVVLIYSITSEIKNNRKLNRIAYIDPHTGLPNKRSCDEKMNDLMIIDGKSNVCCIMFDLNNLKTTNDTYGHEIGDVLIRGFASLLRQNMPSDMFVGRLGGDEFIGIQKNADKEDIDRRINMMIKDANNEDYTSGCSNIYISFAYGYAFSEEQSTDCTIKSLMNIADKNMYYNKIEMKKKQGESKGER